MNLIECDDIALTLRCRQCKDTREIRWRDWILQDAKMNAIEEFAQQHRACNEIRLKQLQPFVGKR
jgi:hypothetical protein